MFQQLGILKVKNDHLQHGSNIYMKFNDGEDMRFNKEILESLTNDLEMNENKEKGSVFKRNEFVGNGNFLLYFFANLYI